MARKTKEEAEKTYLALLDAASKLFIRQGIGKTTLNQIATNANVTRGAVYWHFKNKDDVVISLWKHYAAPYLHPIEKKFIDMEGPDLMATFMALQSELVSEVIQNTKLAIALKIVIHNIELVEDNPDFNAFMEGQHDQFIQALRAAFEKLQAQNHITKDMPAAECAQCLSALYHGLIDQHFSPMSPTKLDTHGLAFIKVLLRGMRP